MSLRKDFFDERSHFLSSRYLYTASDAKRTEAKHDTYILSCYDVNDA